MSVNIINVCVDLNRANITIIMRHSHSCRNERVVIKLFTSKLTQFFQYCMKDITDALMTLDMDTLNSIHSTLADRVKHTFQQFKDRRAVQRIVPRTAAKDIWTLRFCITNDHPTKDLDKILVAQNKEKNGDGNDVDDTSSRMMGHIMELLQTVNDMGDKMKHMQMQISTLQIDNQLLHTQMTAAVETAERSQDKSSPTHEPPELPLSSESEIQPFELPKQQQRKLKRSQRKANEQSSKLKVAPEFRPKRDVLSVTRPHITDPSHVYIGGLHQCTEDVDVKLHLEEMNIDCDVHNLSGDNANKQWKSFKITVPSEKADQVLCEDN